MFSAILNLVLHKECLDSATLQTYFVCKRILCLYMALYHQWPTQRCETVPRSPEAWFNIKMSYQYRNLHCEYKTYLMTVLASQWKFLHKTAATNDWWDEDLYIESGPGIYISGHGIIQLKRPGLNSLAFGRFGRNFRWVIFKLILVIYGSCISCKIALR